MLSAIQWRALRALNQVREFGARGPYQPPPEGFTDQTWTVLLRGLVFTDKAGTLRLTRAGHESLERHLYLTGDGPEELKARFRF